MKSILYDKLSKYSKEVYPFHMPGHKQRKLKHLSNLYKLDVTEVEGTDNLHNPVDIIKKSQIEAANIFGSDKTYFLVNGSTCGIISAITSICNERDKILVTRNSHKSVYNSMILRDLIPIYVYPELTAEGIPGGINPVDIENKLIEEKDIKLVIITSPTYEGIVSNIEEIAKIVHKHEKILMVDEAHGSHFIFSDVFPKTALQMGADIVIQSTHKTLPSFTQSAMLHVKSNRIDINKLQQQLAIFQSSSPSYILMTSLDYCTTLLKKQGTTLFKRYTDMLLKYRNELSNLEHFKLLDESYIGKYAIYDLDKSKLVIDCSKCSLSGTDLDLLLRKDYKIQVELSYLNHIIALTSVFDHKRGFKKLYNSLREIDKCIIEEKKATLYSLINKNAIYYSPKEANEKKKKSILLEKSVGKIMGEFIIPYPPGIPLIVPGEVLTNEIIETINEYKKSNITIIGTEDEKINYIQVIE